MRRQPETQETTFWLVCGCLWFPGRPKNLFGSCAGCVLGTLTDGAMCVCVLECPMMGLGGAFGLLFALLQIVTERQRGLPPRSSGASSSGLVQG